MAISMKKKTDEAVQAPVAEEKVVAKAAEVETVMDAVAPVADDTEYGTASSKVAFVCALGDPSRDDFTPADAKTGKPERHDPTIVGYKFRVLEDMDVPDCGIPSNLLKNNMGCDESMINNTVHVTAGTEVRLTRFETGLFLSRPEFNAMATGGEVPVGVSYTVPKGANSATAAVAAMQIPLVTLRPLSKNGISLKDIPMEEVLSYREEPRENGRVRKVRTLKDGFEKWESLCKVATPQRATSASTAAVNRKNDKAALFLKIAQAKATK